MTRVSQETKQSHTDHKSLATVLRELQSAIAAAGGSYSSANYQDVTVTQLDHCQLMSMVPHHISVQLKALSWVFYYW